MGGFAGDISTIHMFQRTVGFPAEHACMHEETSELDINYKKEKR